MVMTSSAVEGLLRLLCYTSGTQTAGYKKLAEVPMSSSYSRNCWFIAVVKVWLPDKGSMPKVTCNGQPVDLLTPKLRAFMLEFEHKKIVKVSRQVV